MCITIVEWERIFVCSMSYNSDYKMKSLVLLAALIYLAEGSPAHNSSSPHKDEEPLMTKVMRMKLREHAKCVEERHCPTPAQPLSNIPCQDGKSGIFTCHNVDLLSFVPLKDLGSAGDGNDIWGWTDPATGQEYAIVGCTDGTSFVEITDPINPVVKGFLETQTSTSLWRDIKVYKDHAFIVSEASDHGMQVYDLRKLRGLDPGLNKLRPTAFYNGGNLGHAHNIVGSDTGYMYAVGARSSDCNGGLHIINVNNPTDPKFEDCFSQDGYVHDAQCVIYKGPDTRFLDQEICFCYNENTLTIVDVTEKKYPVMLGRKSYNGYAYTHQGWLNEEQSHLLLNDELDEISGYAPTTRSMVWSVKDLTNPVLTGSFYSTEKAVDHNLYINGTLAYEANYSAGLRILDITTMTDDEPNLEEVGFFDLSPEYDSTTFNGAWSSYVYFKSETIIVNSIERGLFVLKYTGPKPE